MDEPRPLLHQLGGAGAAAGAQPRGSRGGWPDDPHQPQPGLAGAGPGHDQPPHLRCHGGGDRFDRTGHRPGAGDGGREGLQHQPVQPRRPGPALAGIHVQAVRLPRRPQGGHEAGDGDQRHQSLLRRLLPQELRRPGGGFGADVERHAELAEHGGGGSAAAGGLRSRDRHRQEPGHQSRAGPLLPPGGGCHRADRARHDRRLCRCVQPWRLCGAHTV